MSKKINSKNNKKNFLIVIAVVSLFSSVYFAGAYSMTEIFPEDWSFRSGLPHTIKHYEGNNLVKLEKNTWNSRYPFEDPTDKLINWIPSDGTGFLKDNVGFMAKIVRNPKSQEAGIHSGKISYNIAVIPFLEGKETIIYDKNNVNRFDTYAQLTESDKYGNPKKIHNLGLAVRGTSGRTDGDSIFDKSFKTYNIRDPRNRPDSADFPPIQVSSQHTTFMEGDAPTNYGSGVYVRDVEPADTAFIETDYLYEKYPIENFIACWEEITGPGQTETVCDFELVKKSHTYYGLTNTPDKTSIKDAYGRVLSEIQNRYFGPQNQQQDFADCTNIHRGSNNRCHGIYCVRQAPIKITTYGEIAKGFDPRGYELGAIPIGGNYYEYGEPVCYLGSTKQNAISNSVDIAYDDCGNVVDLTVRAQYKNPLLPLDPNQEDAEYSSLYSKRVKTDYTGHAIKPVSVITFGPPDISTSATYYSGGDGLLASRTDERGITSNHDYDSLGRLTKVIVLPDTETDPTAMYEYMIGKEFTQDPIIITSIRERRKIESGRYIETYYFYDGMGRFIQSKTIDDNGTPGDASDDTQIISGNKYDVLGRISVEYKPVRISSQVSPGTFARDFYTSGGYTDLEGNPQTAPSKTYEYDSLNRITQITDFDGSVTTKTYDLGNEFSDYGTTVTTQDPLNNIRTFYSDSKGNLLTVELPQP